MNSFTEPPADMRQLATGLRQMFIALTESGFTEPQAMEIVTNMLIASGSRESE